MTITNGCSDQVNIVSQLADTNGHTTAIYSEIESPGEYNVAIGDFPTSNPGHLQTFNRDLMKAFDGTNYWFGYVLWVQFPGDQTGPVALTYNGDKQQITLTPYQSRSPKANQIWGMRVQNKEGFYVLQTYNWPDNEVMDIFGGVAKPGTPIVAFHYDEGKNQHWQYQPVYA